MTIYTKNVLFKNKNFSKMNNFKPKIVFYEKKVSGK